MPLKRVFNVTIRKGDEVVSIRVCQLRFSNGYTLFKLYQQKKAIWLINFNDKWMVSKIQQAEYFTLLAIIKLYSYRQITGYMHTV